MEYGKLNDIQGVDWTFPEEDLGNARRLVGTKRSLKFHLGSPAWGNRHWIGKIYPEHTPSERFLFFYSRQFTCIELNTTHYRIPDEKTARDWILEVPKNFLFCPKVHKDISHSRVGLLDKGLHKHWFGFLDRLGHNLGPSFIQFHENFSYSEKHLLFKFLESWPSEFRLSLELRHPSWFQRNTVLPALADYLHKKEIGLVATDVAGKREVLHTSLSTSWAFIRLVGNDLDPSDERRLGDWATKLKDWETQGLKEVFLLLHQPDDIWTIEFAALAHRVFSRQGFEDFPLVEVIKPTDLLSLM